MTMPFRDIAADAAADGILSAGEILSLRGHAWRDGKIDPDEAEALFLANEACAEPSQEWSDFFAEALSEFIVNTVPPQGYVDQAMGDELVSRIDHDGRVDSMVELELLVRVLEKSLSTPATLKAYALRQIEAAVLEGDGPTRHGALEPHGINATEAALLRRMIFSAGGDRPASVGKAEAEMLFRIKDASLHEANAAEWETLFVQGVANYLLGFGGHEPLTCERAGELETFMTSEGLGVGGFLAKVFTSKPDFGAAFGSLLKLGKDGDGLELGLDEAAEEAAELEAGEQDWLRDRLEADEEIDPLEKALIAFVDAETGGQFVPRPQG